METERAAVYGVIGLVLATTLVSGPIVGAVDFTTATDNPAYGGSNATLHGVSLPESAELGQGRYGAGEYILRVADATITVDEVVGGPVLAYRISIPSMEYSRTTTHFITAANTGPYAVSMADDSLATSMVENHSYQGQLFVFLRSNGTERRLAERNITVEVTE